jgi:archaellum biogenesis ATPase FlaH
MSDNQDPNLLENCVIKFLYIREDIRDKVLPFITDDIFDGSTENVKIISHIKSFVKEYDSFPSFSETQLAIKDVTASNHLIHIMSIDVTEYNDEFLLDEIEIFFQEKMIKNLMIYTFENVEKHDLAMCRDVPDKMREAFAFSFNDSIGLNIFSDESEERMYNAIHTKDAIIPTGLIDLDRLIGGGLHEKTLTLFLAQTNMGKSLIMSSIAVANLLQNKNVLYITCELSEEATAQRIIANMLDTGINSLDTLTRDQFHDHYTRIRKQVEQKFFVKEYPAKGMDTNSIRNLLKELELKQKFVPDVIYVDQIGNMNPIYRVRNDNTYTEMGKVTQELRGLSMEIGPPVVSVIQTNRDGFGKSELDLSNTGDSIGFVQTADIVIGVSQSEELRKVGKYLWGILKNRYGLNMSKFTVCVNYEKMRVTDDTDSVVSGGVAQSEKEMNNASEEAILDIQQKMSQNQNKNGGISGFIDYE